MFKSICGTYILLSISSCANRNNSNNNEWIIIHEQGSFAIGDAGRSTVEGTITPTPDEQEWFGRFRIGIWPDYAVSALFTKIGQAILVTHSHSGGMGWLTAIKNSNVKAIVSYEPGSGFVFPEGEVPASKESSGGILEAVGVSMSAFEQLTKSQ